MSASPAGSRWASAVACLAIVGFCWGCVRATQPEALFQLSGESPQHRAAQTRYFETPDEGELLSASAAVLQDLGFQVEESVPAVGFLRAAKERSAREHMQNFWRLVAYVLTALGNNPVMIPVDLHQQIAATMITRPVDPEAMRHEVRIMFYRVVWKGDGSDSPPGQQKMEMIRDPAVYQRFFAKLSKAVFLEAHGI
jgi:hypothetical protein